MVDGSDPRQSSPIPWTSCRGLGACGPCADRSMSAAALLRIGELSRRHGVSPDLLRVWERRYGLLQPERSDGGFRLYTPRDDERVRVDAAQPRPGLLGRPSPRGWRCAAHGAGRAAERDGALDAAARAELAERARGASATSRPQTSSTGCSPPSASRPCCATWCCPTCATSATAGRTGEVSVAQEHFASAVLRGRLLGLARGFDVGDGPARPARLPAAASTTTSGCSASASACASTAGGSRTSAPTPRSRRSRRRRVRLEPDLVVICAEQEAPLRAVIRQIAELARSIRWPSPAGGLGRDRPRHGLAPGAGRPDGRRRADRGRRLTGGSYSLWETTLRGGRGSAVCQESRRLSPSSAAVL